MIDQNSFFKIDSLRLADPNDADAVAALINHAYRPAPGEEGWTHESEIVAGPRTDAVQVREVIKRPESVLLVAANKDVIAACVHVERRGEDAYIGMLAVSPELQGQGLAKNMLERAERHAQQHFGVTRFVMVVVSTRIELINYYLRRGYHRTGESMDYPLNANAGLPKQPGLQVEILAKSATQ